MAEVQIARNPIISNDRPLANQRCKRNCGRTGKFNARFASHALSASLPAVLSSLPTAIFTD
jgi:hypothetical protein